MRTTLDWGLRGARNAVIATYRTCAASRDDLIRASLSGRELAESGYAADVAASLADDAHPWVVRLERDHFVRVR